MVLFFSPYDKWTILLICKTYVDSLENIGLYNDLCVCSFSEKLKKLMRHTVVLKSQKSRLPDHHSTILFLSGKQLPWSIDRNM